MPYFINWFWRLNPNSKSILCGEFYHVIYLELTHSFFPLMVNSKELIFGPKLYLAN